MLSLFAWCKGNTNFFTVQIYFCNFFVKLAQPPIILIINWLKHYKSFNYTQKSQFFFHYQVFSIKNIILINLKRFI